MRLILIRHGQTEHNRKGTTLGRADVPLNERGRLQARAIAASFVRQPDALYSSPLARARGTAAAIALQAGVETVIDERLIELDVGEMEHLSGEELRQRYPDFMRAWLSPEVADARMPGGETLREAAARASAAVEAMRAACPEGTVAAVSHNFIIRAILCEALNLPLADFRRLHHAVAAISVVDFGRRGTIVRSLNDNSHLAAAGLADDP